MNTAVRAPFTYPVEKTDIGKTYTVTDFEVETNVLQNIKLLNRFLGFRHIFPSHMRSQLLNIQR